MCTLRDDINIFNMFCMSCVYQNEERYDLSAFGLTRAFMHIHAVQDLWLSAGLKLYRVAHDLIQNRKVIDL